jgi:predicted metalloendopeptidase
MQQVVDLYNSFTVLDTLHVKGNLTLGETTADAGGVAIAYDAFKLTPQGHDQPPPSMALYRSTVIRLHRTHLAGENERCLPALLDQQ